MRQVFLLAAFLGSVCPCLSLGGEKSAQCADVKGILLAKAGSAWRSVGKGEAVPLKTSLVALPEASLLSADGTVALDLKADIGHRGPLPVLESAIIVHPSKMHALDVTLERGIIALRNLSKADAAVRVHLRGAHWDWTLRPGAKVGMELYGRYAPGVLKDFSKPGEDSSAQVAALIVEGKAFLKSGDEGFGLSAPPGVAMLHWDNFDKKVHGARLEKLPDFIRPMTDKEAAVFKKSTDAAATLAGKDMDAALKKLLSSDDVVSRQTAVVAAGAIDDLAALFQALEDEKHKEVRDLAILVLRHYLGRGEQQVVNVFTALTGPAMRTPVQASLFLELALGFTAEQRHQPATYEVLIRLLDHARLAVRELAYWHLVRLVPLETPIAFDAAGSAESRAKSVARWRATIPTGELPPHLRESKAPAP